MRLHAGVGNGPDDAPCRVLLGGYGVPGCRDLDFGERFVRLAEVLEWPEGVVVEHLPCSPHLVLHRLQELRPAKMVLVGAAARGADRPGTVRRRRVDPSAPSADDLHALLTDGEGVSERLDGVLALVRRFGCQPSDTVVFEVEAADTSFGFGFSEELAAAIDPLLAAVREEVDSGTDGEQVEPAVGALVAPASGYPTSTSPGRAPGGATRPAAPPGIEQLFQYAHAHAQVRALEALAARAPAHPGVAVAARFRPGGSWLGTSGDWYDVITPADHVLCLVVADVAGGPRLHAATVAAQLASAVRALALVEGRHPARVLAHLDHLVTSSGVGEGTTLAYLALDTRDGTLRLANAGHPAPLVVSAAGDASPLAGGRQGALGTSAAEPHEVTARLEAGATLLLPNGALAGAGCPSADAAPLLRVAARSARQPLDDQCDHLVAWGSERARGADVSVLGVRRLGAAW